MTKKSDTGSILSFVSTLSMRDARDFMTFWHRHDRLPNWALTPYQEFLAKRQEKTPQGGPAGQST